MDNIFTKSGDKLSWIGIGTYGIGGRGHRDVELTEIQSDEIYLKALLHQFDLGFNFTEISLGYGHGNACRIFAKALQESTLNREQFFITNALYPRDFNSFSDILSDIKEMHKIFNTDYFDSTLITQSLIEKYNRDKIFSLLHDLLDSDKTSYVSVSNASKNFINEFSKEFGDKVFAHETHLSFEVRINQDEGIFDTCRKLNIENIIWRPLRRNNTAERNWNLLTELSGKYDKTQSQIILNWMHYYKLRPMVSSTSKEHIEENWSANQFSMDAKDYERMQDFRIPELKTPVVDWDQNMDDLVNFAVGFDDLYDKKKI